MGFLDRLASGAEIFTLDNISQVIYPEPLIRSSKAKSAKLIENEQLGDCWSPVVQPNRLEPKDKKYFFPQVRDMGLQFRENII